MSLYREAGSGRRRVWIAAASVAVVALAVAVALRAFGGEQSDAERLRSLQDDVQPALIGLELVPIHYASAKEQTHAAAADQLDVARRTVAAHEEELRTLDPRATDRLLADLEELAALVRTTGRVDAIEQAAGRAAAALRALVRLD